MKRPVDRLSRQRRKIFFFPDSFFRCHQEYEDLLRKGSQNGPVFIYLACCYFMLGKYDEAEQVALKGSMTKLMRPCVCSSLPVSLPRSKVISADASTLSHCFETKRWGQVSEIPAATAKHHWGSNVSGEYALHAKSLSRSNRYLQDISDKQSVGSSLISTEELVRRCRLCLETISPWTCTWLFAITSSISMISRKRCSIPTWRRILNRPQPSIYKRAINIDCSTAKLQK